MKDLENKEIIPFILKLKRLKFQKISTMKRCVTLEIFILSLLWKLKKWARKEFKKKFSDIPYDKFDALLHKFIFPSK
jgi:hypothetical protein